MNSAPFQSTRDVIIQVPDLQKAIKFYTDVLGLKQTYRNERCVGFESGGFQLFVEQGTRPGPVFEFRVPDLETARQRLLASGCHVVEDDPQVSRLYMRDPYGLIFNLDQC